MRYAIEDDLVMIAELSVDPVRVDDFLDYTARNLSISRSWPGNVSFDILVDEIRPGQVVFHEVWQTAEAQQVYMAWRTQAGDLTTLLSYLTASPRFLAYRRIADPSPASPD